MHTQFMAKGLPGLAVGVILVRTMMFPFLAVTQQRCMQSKLTKYLAVYSSEGGFIYFLWNPDFYL